MCSPEKRYYCSAAEDYPVIQSAQGGKDAATLTVALVNPQPTAAYYLRLVAGGAQRLFFGQRGKPRVPYPPFLLLQGI